MPEDKKRIYLASFIYSGRATQIWRHPDVHAHESLDVNYYIEYAKIAEKARFDTLFLADGPARPIKDESKHFWSVSQFEPVTLFSAIATHTKHIGLVYTASVSNNEPSHVARQIASLDHISHGRAGWNIVTTQGEGTLNLGITPEESADSKARYGRARAFHDAVRRLLDTFEDDALPRDKASGIYADLSKIHSPHINNDYYRIELPLNVERIPQGQPILAQAGTSPEGLAFGGSTADLIYACAFSIPDGQALYQKYKEQAVAAGRRAEDIKILAGAAVIWGPTQEEAERRLKEATSFWPIDVLIENLGIDFGPVPYSDDLLDAPFPQAYKLSPTGIHGRAAAIALFAHANKLTLRQTAERVSISLGHRPLVGTTQSIADDLQAWVEEGAADGFAVIQPRLLDGLREFSEHVIPELQRRGLYPREYEGNTFRENLGLPRPANIYAVAQAADTVIAAPKVAETRPPTAQTVIAT